MPKVDFKSYQKPEKSDMPSMIDIVVSKYGIYLTIDQFAECIGIKYNLAYGLVRAGTIKSSRTRGHSGSYRIAAVDIVKHMAA